MNPPNIIDSIFYGINAITGRYSKEEPISLHEPCFSNTNAWKYVKECIDTGWVSSGGDWVKKFEQSLCDFTGADYAIAITNGTDALRLALYLAGVREGDEVFIPSISFVATANAIAHLGAVPHFIDIELNSKGMCPKSLEKVLKEIAQKNDKEIINVKTGRRIAAIVPVHIFGHPADLISLKKIANEWNLPIVEDSAEALGSYIKHKDKYKHCGLFGDLGIISFNGNKIITTGGGGAIITNNKELALEGKHISTTAKINHPWEFEHDQLGWNDRMPNINAALGVAQMEQLEKIIIQKRAIATHYKNSFKEVNGVEIIDEPSYSKSNFWLVSLRLNYEDINQVKSIRNKLLNESHSKGLFLRPCWKPLHTLKPYLNSPKGVLHNTESEYERIINLPSSPFLLKNFC